MSYSGVLKFRNSYASLDLSIHKEGSAAIANFYSRKRRQGYGSALLREVISFADQNNLKLLLEARPYGPGKHDGNERLVKLYERFGFKVWKQGGKPTQLMIRKKQPEGEATLAATRSTDKTSSERL